MPNAANQNFKRYQPETLICSQRAERQSRALATKNVYGRWEQKVGDVTVIGGPTQDPRYKDAAKDAYWDIEIKRGSRVIDKFTVTARVGFIQTNEMAQLNKLNSCDGTRKVWLGLIV